MNSPWSWTNCFVSALSGSWSQLYGSGTARSPLVADLKVSTVSARRTDGYAVCFGSHAVFMAAVSGEAQMRDDATERARRWTAGRVVARTCVLRCP